MDLSDNYTVIIPAYNAEDTIGEAVQSILAQTVPAQEIIIVDDGSTDNTAGAVGVFGSKVKLIKQQNSGVAAATNTALKAVATPLLAALDADDIWKPDKMAMQLRHLYNNPQTGAVFCRGITFRDIAGKREYKNAQDIWGRSAMLIKSADAIANGDLIEPPGGLGDMVDWIARLRENGVQLDLMPDVLVERRIRPGSMTFSRRGIDNKGYVFVAREAILRRRAAAKRQG
ncbi:glycosyltransferase family A protein [Hoeflea poritis]|uniref:Glycosyltransferase family A protein n=1 Tax=Hoeflea poritis TaxID=2993659 RepID=A0ABT4VH79_9HYPH|nr:glycosyltransferase family A protein [Hoeflea poritis]MDA4844054.1 glycosyltransferase family A protein [Hoeflea poritis]